MLGSTIQHIGGVRRPLRLAQVTRFPLIKIAAEVASEIRTGARRPQKLPGARSIKPGIVTDQLVWQAWIFVLQIDHEILEGAVNVTARKARARGPCRRQSQKTGHEMLQRVLGQNEPERPNDMRCRREQNLPLDQRLAHEAEFVIFQVTQPAMHELSRARRSSL